MFFHQTLQKQFTNIWKTLSLPGYPYSPFLGAALAGEETWTGEGKTRWQIFWQSCVQITIRGITKIGVSFGLSLKYVSYIYHSKRSKCAVSNFLSSFRFVPQWTSPVAAGDRWLNLPQGQQMPAAKYFSGCLQTGSAPLQLSRRIHTLTCLPPWTGMGGTMLAQASWSIPGQVFLPRMPWSSPNTCL